MSTPAVGVGRSLERDQRVDVDSSDWESILTSPAQKATQKAASPSDLLLSIVGVDGPASPQGVLLVAPVPRAPLGQAEGHSEGRLNELWEGGPSGSIDKVTKVLEDPLQG